MKWYREWRLWVQWKRAEDEKKLRETVLSELTRLYPEVASFGSYFPEFVISTVRDYDSRDKGYWQMR